VVRRTADLDGYRGRGRGARVVCLLSAVRRTDPSRGAGGRHDESAVRRIWIDWFSIFLAWGVKAMILPPYGRASPAGGKFGGLPLYRRILPLFMGFILGSCLGVGTTAVIGLCRSI